MYELHSSRAYVTKCHTPGGPTTTELDSRLVLEAGGPKSNVGRAILPPMALEKTLAWPLPARGGRWQSWAFLGSLLHPGFRLPVRGLTCCMSVSGFLIRRTSVIGLGPTLI